MMGCCQATEEGAVPRLITDPPKIMGDGTEVSPGSLTHGVLTALGWKLGYHCYSDPDASCSRHPFTPVGAPSGPFTTTRRVSALLYWIENATSLSSPHELSFLELCPRYYTQMLNYPLSLNKNREHDALKNKTKQETYQHIKLCCKHQG